jgi:hypothetical protein
LGVRGEFAGDVAAGPSGGVDAGLVEDVADLADVPDSFQGGDVGDHLGGVALQLDWMRCGSLCVLRLARARVRVRW